MKVNKDKNKKNKPKAPLVNEDLIKEGQRKKKLKPMPKKKFDWRHMEEEE
jgi:hypothetical protein